MAEPTPASGSSSTSLWIVVVLFLALGLAGLAVFRHVRETQQQVGPEKGFLYDIAQYRHTDPALIRYREASRIATGFQQARGLALAVDGRVLVAGDKSLRVFRPDGARLAEWPLAAEPYCLACAPDGVVHVGMKDHVEVLGPDGAAQTKWTALPKPAYVTAIAASDQAVWVADAGNRVVWRFNRQGERTGSVGGREDAPRDERLSVPSPHLDVAVDPAGMVWISNPGQHHLQGYTLDGAFQRSWGEAAAEIQGFSGCCNPTDFALLPDGRFVTSEKGIPRVKVYTKEGKFESVVAGAESFAEDVAGLDLAADAQGRIYVLDPAEKAVRIFEAKAKE